MDDNPHLLKNDPEYVSMIESLGGGLGRAWRYGDWDAIEGAFFHNFDYDFLVEDPFMIQPKDSVGRIYASMDYGFGPNGRSSCGVWYIDKTGFIRRLMTWTEVGMNAEEQASSLFDTIEGFPYLMGMFPIEVVCDHNMFVNQNLEASTRAPIDYFRERFAKQISPERWLPANKARVPGWDVLSNLFNPYPITLQPKMKFWRGYNESWAENIQLLEEDPNRPGDVLKCDIDHEADESRYGVVKLAALKATVEKSATTTHTTTAWNAAAKGWSR